MSNFKRMRAAVQKNGGLDGLIRSVSVEGIVYLFLVRLSGSIKLSSRY